MWQLLIAIVSDCLPRPCEPLSVCLSLSLRRPTRLSVLEGLPPSISPFSIFSSEKNGKNF